MAKDTSYDGFTKDEIAAMKARAAELKVPAARAAQDCLDTIAGMPDVERTIAQRLHAIVTKLAPEIETKTWYGMPAYARDGKVVVFFKHASKFKMRYSEVGFQEFANLDDGDMWPTVFAVTAMNPKVEKELTALVNQALS